MSLSNALPQAQVHTQGHVSDALVEYATDKVATVLRHAPAPVLFVHLTLHRPTDPAGRQPASARVDLDVNGMDLHAHASAPSLREAVDLMQDRLRARLTRETRH
jgi:ribosome-associated translation inhibitor RaiA